jgi:uncharacterized membrane protein YeaQ/YmgE (transglycosylase-associated protein family)
MDIGGIIGGILAAPFICIGWLIVGAIAGGIAHNVMKTNQPIVVDVIVGLIGAVVGGFLVSLLGIYRPEGGIEGVIVSLIVSTIGAIVLLYVIKLVRR